MKAIFKDIGPIKKAELELGDFTIIAGQNNTGKTYLVYALYGFLSMVRKRDFLITSFMRHAPESIYTKDLTRELIDNGKIIISKEEYKEIKDTTIKLACETFSSDHLSQVFSSPNEEFQNAKFQFISGDESILKEGGRQALVFGKIQINYYVKNEVVIIELDASVSAKEKKIDEVSIGLRLALYKIVQDSHPDLFILSAERFGISLFYKELDFTKNRLVEELQKLSGKKNEFDPSKFIDEESAYYAKPIKDNIDFTRKLSNIQKRKSELVTDKIHSVDKIMGGYYKVINDDIRFISKRRKDNHFNIPLHLASSSARGVADLYFYLKHVAKPGQLLIIDEPESHLSPTNQVFMARLLVFCVNAGIKVLITTHSDYLIKEINNLVMLHGDFEGKNNFLTQHKKQYTGQDHLDPDKVRAYICEEGKLVKCEINHMGIDMPVFDKAIDDINSISNQLGLMRGSEL